MTRDPKLIWNDETPNRVPAGARISAGKSGKVANSFPAKAVARVNWPPVNCMPSPESPANRTTADSTIWRAGESGVFSARAVGDMEIRSVSGQSMMLSRQRSKAENTDAGNGRPLDRPSMPQKNCPARPLLQRFHLSSPCTPPELVIQAAAAEISPGPRRPAGICRSGTHRYGTAKTEPP